MGEVEKLGASLVFNMERMYEPSSFPDHPFLVPDSRIDLSDKSAHVRIPTKLAHVRSGELS